MSDFSRVMELALAADPKKTEEAMGVPSAPPPAAAPEKPPAPAPAATSAPKK